MGTCVIAFVLLAQTVTTVNGPQGLGGVPPGTSTTQIDITTTTVGLQTNTPTLTGTITVQKTPDVAETAQPAHVVAQSAAAGGGGHDEPPPETHEGGEGEAPAPDDPANVLLVSYPRELKVDVGARFTVWLETARDIDAIIQQVPADFMTTRFVAERTTGLTLTSRAFDITLAGDKCPTTDFQCLLFDVTPREAGHQQLTIEINDHGYAFSVEVAPAEIIATAVPAKTTESSSHVGAIGLLIIGAIAGYLAHMSIAARK